MVFLHGGMKLRSLAEIDKKKYDMLFSVWFYEQESNKQGQSYNM